MNPMPKRELSDQLNKNTIFEGLSAEQIAEILPCIALAVKTYGAHECIYDKGDEVRDLGLVLDGELLVCDDNGDGKRTVVANIEKNGLFGEAQAFSSSSSLPHRVVAQKPAEVLYLNGDFFLAPCQKSCEHRGIHQEVVKNMLRLLSDRTVMLNKKIAYLTADDLKMKIAMYLCELYELNGSAIFNMPLNRDRLAEFFSVARPSLSRELTNLKNMEIIDFYRSSVKILDADRLYALARGDKLDEDK